MHPTVAFVEIHLTTSLRTALTAHRASVPPTQRSTTTTTQRSTTTTTQRSTTTTTQRSTTTTTQRSTTALAPGQNAIPTHAALDIHCGQMLAALLEAQTPHVALTRLAVLTAGHTIVPQLGLGQSVIQVVVMVTVLLCLVQMQSPAALRVH